MKKTLTLAVALCAAMNMNADNNSNTIGDAELFSYAQFSSDSIRQQFPNFDAFCADSSRVARKRYHYIPIEDIRLSDTESSTMSDDSWASNWFVGLQGGASVFVSTPLGCGDVFDRISPNFNVYAGKWFTPAVGARISYQGFVIKDCQLQSQSMHSIHANLMYNVMSYRHKQAKDQRFDLIPYVGCGLIHNSDLPNSEFSLNYGIQAKYHLNDRLHLSAELSGLTTFQGFDGYGNANRLGDHKIDLSVGLAVNIGKIGFRKHLKEPVACMVLDRPDMYIASLHRNSDGNRCEYENDDGYNYGYANSKYVAAPSSTTAKRRPVNNYSGLNSLRARLAAAEKAKQNANNQTDNNISDICHCGGNDSCGCSTCTDRCSSNGCSGKCQAKGSKGTKGASGANGKAAKASLINGADTLGLTIPYICHFKINTHDLTNKRQLDYLSEIVKLAKERGMAIRVTGAADSATGTAAINQCLSEKRANYISDQLIALGMSAENIEQQALGGIEEFTNIANNRYCKIQILPIAASQP